MAPSSSAARSSGLTSALNAASIASTRWSKARCCAAAIAIALPVV